MIMINKAIKTMTVRSKCLLSCAALLVGALSFSSSAKAEIFYWQDADTKMSFTYPDRWDVRHNHQPDDIYAVAAPGANNHAICRLRVREDSRFAIFPEYFDSNIQRIAYSRQFWEDYLAEYDNPEIQSFYDGAGLGRGFASYANVTYTTASGPKMDKQALMFVSLYNKKAYIIECSAERASYAKWHPSFMSVVKSVNFRKEVNEAKNGYYRNFYNGTLRIQNERPIDVSIY